MDDAERSDLIGRMDSNVPGILFAYDMWRQHDGTKAGLLRVIAASTRKR